MNDQNNPELTQVEALQAEIARLQALLMGKFNKETLLTDLQVGSMTLQGGAAALLAEMFAHQFVQEQAGNYLELQFTSQQVLPGERFVVTLQKVSGKTPHIALLKDELNLLSNRLRSCVHRNSTASAWPA